MKNSRIVCVDFEPHEKRRSLRAASGKTLQSTAYSRCSFYPPEITIGRVNPAAILLTHHISHDLLLF